ncbi:MAG: LPS export ABC transporter permease LptG [Deltaproteobacteria bacterium]|nr:LPS export ABC transporter permease LptG [Deltaproteobacteria bacterium]MBW2135615.1 LPS export ABC transporter permease LptG [Deltaproteobacteria bacterium]
MEKTASTRSRLFRWLILEQYVAREFIKLFLLTLVTLVSVYLIGAFSEKIGRLVQAQLDLIAILSYFSARVPEAVGQVLPAAVLLAVMITLGLLARHNETIAIRTCGINIFCLIRPLVMLAGGLSLILFFLNFYFIPWTQQQMTTIWETQVEKKPPRSLINMERFWYKGDRAIFNILMFRKDTQTLEGVKIYLFDQQFRLVQLIAAKRAQWDGDRWHFYQGISQIFTPAGSVISESFQKRIIPLTEQPDDFAVIEKKISEMDFTELYRYIDRLEHDGYDPTEYRLDLQRRMALSLTPLIVTLIGGGLALFREKTYIPAVIATGIAVVFVYWLFIGFCLSLGEAGRLPVFWAVWLPNVLFTVLGLVWLIKNGLLTLPKSFSSYKISLWPGR